MEWLFKPKVQLGLFVNFIFIIFTLVSSVAGGRTYERRVTYVPSPPASQPLPYIPLPPPTRPSKATSFLDKATGELNVYLDSDMSLIRRPGFVLLLSPTCTVQGKGEAPGSVLLRFISFSGAQYFAYDDSLTITADDVQVWPAVSQDAGPSLYPRSYEKVPRSVTFGTDGRVVETVGKEIPYEVFVKVISAKRVNFQLGPEATDLTAEQLRALRDMHRLLSQPPEEMRKRF
jgi:hypothetical protein